MRGCRGARDLLGRTRARPTRGASIDAVPTARDVSRRSALFALGGASTGGVWALDGPGAHRRAPGAAPDQRERAGVDRDRRLRGLTVAQPPGAATGPAPPMACARSRRDARAPRQFHRRPRRTRTDADARSRAPRASSPRRSVSFARVDRRARQPAHADPGRWAPRSRLRSDRPPTPRSWVASSSSTRSSAPPNACKPNARCARSRRPETRRFASGSAACSASCAADSLVVGDVIELGCRRHRARRLPAPRGHRARGRRVGDHRRVAAGRRRRVVASAGCPDRGAHLDALRRQRDRRRACGRARGRGRTRHRSRTRRGRGGRAAAVGRRAPARSAHPPDRAGDPRGRRARDRARLPLPPARRATRSARASRSPSRRCPKGSRRSRRSPRSRRRAGSRRATRSCATRARSKRSVGSTRSASTRRARSRRARSRSRCVSDGAADEQLDALSEHGRLVLAAALRATPAARAATTCSPTPPTRRSSSARDALGSRRRRGTGRVAAPRRDPVRVASRLSRGARRRRRRRHRATLDHGEGRARGRDPPLRHVAPGRARRSSSTRPTRRALEDHVDALGRRGLRVLAVAEAPATTAPSSVTAPRSPASSSSASSASPTSSVRPRPPRCVTCRRRACASR